MSGETEKQVSGWTVDTLKELHEAEFRSVRRELAEIKESTVLARKEMERRLGELNQLRSEVTQDRDQLVRREVYEPTMKELTAGVNKLADDHIQTTNDVSASREAIANLKNNLSWLARLVVGAVILALIAFGFRALTGR